MDKNYDHVGVTFLSIWYFLTKTILYSIAKLGLILDILYYWEDYKLFPRTA